jgi:uncharacterized membrane protein YphA (DoxX/SURF4 family)
MTTAPAPEAAAPTATTAPATTSGAKGLPNAFGWLVMFFRVAIAGLFLFAAYHKLWGEQAPQVFSDSVRAFRVSSSEFSVRMATSVTPWVEVVASICLLLIATWSRAAAIILSLMLVMFIALISRAIINGYDLECGCFGDLSPFCPKKVSSCNIVQNVILLAMSLTVALTPRHRLVRAAGPV